MLLKADLDNIHARAGEAGFTCVVEEVPEYSYTSVTLSHPKDWGNITGGQGELIKNTFLLGAHGEFYGDNPHLLEFPLIYPGKIFRDFSDFNLHTGELFTEDGWRGRYGCYGVCDNVEQVLEKYKNVVDNPSLEVALVLTPVFKEEQPESGGWRWHKWGEYIGTKQPSQEYLYDEEDIDFVLCYHLYVVEK